MFGNIVGEIIGEAMPWWLAAPVAGVPIIMVPAIYVRKDLHGIGLRKRGPDA